MLGSKPQFIPGDKPGDVVDRLDLIVFDPKDKSLSIEFGAVILKLSNGRYIELNVSEWSFLSHVDPKSMVTLEGENDGIPKTKETVAPEGTES